MKEVFRLRRSMFRGGLFALPLFLAMLIFSVVCMYHDAPPGRGALVAAVAVVFWSFWVGLTVWLLLACRRESITLDDDQVRFTGVLDTRTIALPAVLRARWRRPPQPSLTLFWRGGKVMVWFRHYRADQRGRLIRSFRERIAPEVQEGWSDDLERYAAEVAAKESAAEYDRFFRALWRLALAGPPVGVVCGLVLHLYAARLGVTDLPTWTGSPLLDWGAIGALVGVATLAMLWVLKWVDQPER